MNFKFLMMKQYLASFAPDFAELCGLITFRSGINIGDAELIAEIERERRMLKIDEDGE